MINVSEREFRLEKGEENVHTFVFNVAELVCSEEKISGLTHAEPVEFENVTRENNVLCANIFI